MTGTKSTVADAAATDAAIEARIVESPMGYSWYAVGPKGLLGSDLPARSRDDAIDRLRRRFPNARHSETLLPDLADDLRRFYAGEDVDFDVTLDLDGVTAFSRKIYTELRKVERGTVVTYGELAERVGAPGAARGVGQAMARNPLPPIVPCHRVIASDGTIGGFSAVGGTNVKERLLALEGAPKVRIPKRKAPAVAARDAT